MTPPEILSFGPFNFEPHTGRLIKRSYKVKLQPKAAAALTCLLRRPGEVVTRAQLQSELWPEGTHVDFELGIKVAIKKLRDALGDAAEEPLYIQTVIGEGYRFLAQVETTVAADSNGRGTAGLPPEDATVVIPEPGAVPSSAVRRGTLWWIAAIGAAAAILLALLIQRTAGTAPVNFQDRDWVVIAAFENRTGEKLLDGTMEFALERALSQSRYVNVALRDRINDALTLMRQSPSAVLNEELARQVAIRDGAIKAVLAGRVEKFGLKYILTVRVLEPSRGETVAVFEKQGAESQLPDAARSVSDELRRKLGEKADTVRTKATGLEKATTTSLAALRAFSAGMTQVNQRKWNLAVPLLEEAILEDPQFASAQIYAAHCYSNLQQPEKAAPHYQAAFQLAPGVTQRERLFILGSYYQRFLNDDRRAVDVYQTLVNLYPDDYWGQNNLFVSYSGLGMDRERHEAMERLVALRPNNLDRLEDLWVYYRFDQPDKAKAQQYHGMLQRLRSAGGPPPGGDWAFLDARLDLEAANDRWASGDVKRAAPELARISAHARIQGDGIYKAIIAQANLIFGKLTEAEELCGRVDDPAVRSEILLRIAYVTGNRDLGRKQLPTLRNSGPQHGGNPGIDLFLFAWLGETATTGPWPKLAVDPNVTGRGWVLLAEGRFVEAATLMARPGNRYPYRVNRYPLAIALERQGKREEAIATLEEAPIFYHNLVWDWTWSLCRAKLAELYRKVGRVDDAVKIEDQLRHYLSEADADHPVLAQLRAIGGETAKAQRAR